MNLIHFDKIEPNNCHITNFQTLYYPTVRDRTESFFAVNPTCEVLFTSLAKEVMFLVVLVCLFVRLWAILLEKL